MTRTIEIETTVEVDLDDFDADDLFEELQERGLGKVQFEHLLRHGIEDRDWSKIEEFAQKLDVHFFQEEIANGRMGITSR